MSDEEKAKKSERMKKFWSNPEARANLSATLKKKYSTSEEKEKRSARMKKVCSSPEVRARHSMATKKFWSDPENKTKQSAKIKEGCSTPEVQAKKSALGKRTMESYEAKLRQSVMMKKKMSTPEAKERFSERMTGRVKSENEIELMISRRNQKIICLDTGVVYKNQAEVARVFDVCSETIKNSIDKKRPCLAGSFARLTEYMEEQNARKAS